MKIINITIFLAFFSTNALAYTSQGVFKGPISLKVWKHWQPSWNVELTSKEEDYEFELERYISNDGMEQLSLKMKGQKYINAFARIHCEVVSRTQGWNIQIKTNYLKLKRGQFLDNKVNFHWKESGCHDLNNQQIVKKITLNVYNTTQTLFQYTLSPMYVRGKSNAYMNNSIDSYMAHAGSGNFSIQLLSDLNNDWDTYSNRKIAPHLKFIERNTISQNASVGLHRHEKNQEMWFVEKGQILVEHGVSQKTTSEYLTQRQWSSNEDYQETQQFEALGGWIEQRILNPGDFTVIAPNPNDPNEVTFNGLKAFSSSSENTVFWTLGTKN